MSQLAPVYFPPNYIPRKPMAHIRGALPGQCKVLLVGEAWGEGEEQMLKPFVGESGKELFRILGDAIPEEKSLHAEAENEARNWGFTWIAYGDTWLKACGIAMTNVLALRPQGNNMETLRVPKKEAGPGHFNIPIGRGLYLDPRLSPEFERLAEEIKILKPNIIVALGNTACWALLGATNIGSIRGAIARGHETGVAPGFKVLPTYHPAGVMRNWSWRPIVVADLMKAWRESNSPEIVRPQRIIHINPTLAEVEAWASEIRHYNGLLSCDIETAFGQIKCIGFAVSRDCAFVIPFLDPTKPGWHYWQSPNEELRAWEIVKAVLESPIPKLGQNFMYDIQYITKMGIMPARTTHDTMLLHHSHYPEMQKGLGFLGSIYSNEVSWKLMRSQKVDSEKRDE